MEKKNLKQYSVKQLDQMWATLNASKSSDDGEAAKMADAIAKEIEHRIDKGEQPSGTDVKKSMTLDEFNRDVAPYHNVYTKANLEKFVGDTLEKAEAAETLEEATAIRLNSNKQVQALRKVKIIDKGEEPVTVFISV